MRTRLTTDCFIEPAWRAPSLRPNGAEMSRAVFLALVTSWFGALAALLLAAIVVRLAV